MKNNIDNEIKNIKTDIDSCIKNDQFADNKGNGGIVRINSAYGISMGRYDLSSPKGGDSIIIHTASDGLIKQRTHRFMPITPSNIDYAVKCALTDPRISWKDADKQAVRDLLGINQTIANTIEEKLANAHNTFANALKGTASGEIIGMNDVSPIEHEMGVKVSGVDDLTSVKVRKLGKNLCDNVYEIGGINSDTGQNFDNISYIRSVNYHSIKPNTKYTIKPVDNTPNIRFRFYDKDKNYIGYIFNAVGGGNAFTFTTNADSYFVRFDIAMVSGVDEKLQLELGSTATEYEPYIEPTEYTPDADGVVSGVTSLYPSTTLMTDTDGAIIEATYNKDINKAFEELKNAILATGGNV